MRRRSRQSSNVNLNSLFKPWVNSVSRCGVDSSGLVWGSVVCKGKAIPLQAWTGLKDSRRLRLPEFKTIST